MATATSRIKSAVRGSALRKPRPLPGQKLFTTYPVVDRHDLVGECFQIVDWRTVPAEVTGYEQDSVVMHIRRGAMVRGKFSPLSNPDYDCWTGAFIKGQLENMSEESVDGEYFSCRPGHYDIKSKKATQLPNEAIARYSRLKHNEKAGYAIWLDFFDNFDEDILSEDIEEDEPEEVEDDEPVTRASLNRQMVKKNGNAKAYEIDLDEEDEDEEEDEEDDQEEINAAASRVRSEQSRKSSVKKTPPKALPKKIEVVGNHTYTQGRGRPPSGAVTFNSSTGRYYNAQGERYNKDLRSWMKVKKA